LPDIDVDAFIMERILNLNGYREKQIVYRGFNPMIGISQDGMNILLGDIFFIKLILDNLQDTDKEHPEKKDLSLIKDTNISLERLWHYTSYLTRDRNVSCLCWSEQNHVR
jgi:hypothetical protein